MRRFLIAALIAATSAIAQNPNPLPLTIDTIMRGPNLAGYEPRDVRWSPDSQHVYFGWKQFSDGQAKEFDTWVVNRDGSGLRRLTEDEAKDAPPVRGTWTRDHKRAVYIDDGDVMLWDGHRRSLTNTTAAESNPRFTRDERHVTFVRDNNLYVASLDDGSTVQVTNIIGADEKQPLWDDRKGTASQEFIKTEERKLFDVVEERAKKREEDEAKKKRAHPIKPFKLDRKQTASDIQLSPDGRLAIVSFTTEPEKGKRTIVPNYVSESAYTEDIPSREKVGDVAPVTRIASISTATGEVKWLEHGLKPAEVPRPKVEAESKQEEKQIEARSERTEKQEKSETATAKEREVTYGAVQFSDDGSKAIVSLRARDNKDWWLFTFDPATAKTRLLATVHDDAWVRRMQRSIGWLPDNQTVWFVSEASGFAHLYTVSFDGGTPRQLTSGKWEVEDVTLSDDKKSFLLTTSEESPFVRHLYRVALDGGTRVKLTSGSGRHDAVLSPDGVSIGDVYSYTNIPPEVYVARVADMHPAARDTQPMQRGTATKVTTSPAPEFFTYPWLDVPIVTFRASDGVDVPARMYKPRNWTAGGPAVLFVHGAGYLQNVHQWWSSYFREFMFNHYLMEHGYLVLDIDYRGSAGYGRDWRTAIYRHMGGRDLADEADGAAWLVKQEGVNPQHIGMYGGSYGGFMTLMALFTAPDVFHSGAALRPVTDWAHYNHGYTSDILNTPQADPESYRRSSPIYFAQNLRGYLLICHGVADTNVHFQDTVRLVQKLIELRKENWNVAFYPVEDHSFVEPTSWADEYKRIFALFERTLK